MRAMPFAGRLLIFFSLDGNTMLWGRSYCAKPIHNNSVPYVTAVV